MRTRLFALLLLMLLPFSARAELNLFTPEPVQPSATPSPLPELSPTPLLEAPPFTMNCVSALLMEPESGQVLFELNADAARPVASVTKVMTILLTLEALDTGRISIDDAVTISPEAAGMGGSQVLLDTGEIQPVGTLLKSVIVGSANDGAVALAETLYGSEELFVSRMNERAAELGMTGTHFVNCTGLPAEGQHTTARDVARMSMAMFSHPLYFEFSGIWLDNVDHGDGRITQLTNTNKLIRLYDGCDGGKTGSTNEAGQCMTATAERGGMRLIAVVLGAPDSSTRFDIVEEMFDYGFANYRLYPVAQRGAKVRGTLPVTGGSPDGISLELNGDLTLLILKGDEQSIRLEPKLPASLAAPVLRGAVVGSVDVVMDGRTVASIPIIASEAAEATGFAPNLIRFWEHWPMAL